MFDPAKIGFVYSDITCISTLILGVYKYEIIEDPRVNHFKLYCGGFFGRFNAASGDPIKDMIRKLEEMEDVASADIFRVYLSSYTRQHKIKQLLK